MCFSYLYSMCRRAFSRWRYLWAGLLKTWRGRVCDEEILLFELLEEETMRTHQKIWNIFRRSNGAKGVVWRCAAVALVMFTIVAALSVSMHGLQAPKVAHAEDAVYENVYPYGECTWFANERYRELHGYYVPWTYGNANEWVDRAADYGWIVSSQPVLHSIMVLQVGVQGATGYGHVGVVEAIESDGAVVMSAMNAGGGPGEVTHNEYYPGPGVSFIWG